MTETLATTPSQTIGPFLAIALPWDDGSDLVADGTAGAIIVEGRMLDGAGDPVPDGLVEIWQADPNGRFAHANDPRGAAEYPGFRSFGRSATDSDGRFWFRTLKPGALPAEDDQSEAPHLNVTVFARGMLRHAVTRMYFPDEAEANAADPVLGPLPEADRAVLTASSTDGKLRFDIHLQGSDTQPETPFFSV